jgi:hypothetical protein
MAAFPGYPFVGRLSMAELAALLVLVLIAASLAYVRLTV